MIEQLKKSRWYIDIRGQVQIMTALQIIEGLLNLELKVIYRVSRDRQNWAAICNQEFFEKTVQEYIEHLSKEATKYGSEVGSIQNKDELSGFHNIKGLTTGINEQLEHADQLLEINVKLNSLRNLAAEIIAKKKLVIDLSVPGKIDELHADDRNEYINAPTAWQIFVKRFFSGDKKFRRNVLVVVAAIALVVFGVKKYFALKEEQEIADAKAQAEAALKAKLAGDYAKATALFAGVQNLQALDTQTLIDMADAHAQNKALDSASSLLKIALTKPASPQEMAKANAMMGLISIQKNQSDNAIAYYQDSIKAGAIFDALYNLAVIHLDKAQPELSEPLLLKAVTFPHPEIAIAFLSLIETAIQLDQTTLKKEAANNAPDTSAATKTPLFQRLKNVLPLFDKLMIPSQPYFEEILAARLVVASAMGDHEGFYKLLPMWLDLDPKISATKPYSYSLLYHRVSWNHIVRWCQDVYKDTSLNSLKGAFYAGCVARAKDLKDALPYAQYAYINSNPKDAYLRGFLAHLVWAGENAVGTKQVLREGDITNSKLAKKTLTEVCHKFPDASCPEQ